MSQHDYAAARAAAEALVGLLRYHCSQIEIAGSIRRRKPRVKDLEIVARGRRCPDVLRLFSAADQVDRLGDWLELVVRDGWHDALRPAPPAEGRAAPWGPRYKRLTFAHAGTVYPVDLFQPACAGSWGPTLAIRTGPADFSRLLVTPRQHGGAMPAGLRQREGRLERLRDCSVPGEQLWEPLDTPTESDWFGAIGVPCWAPHERTVARLLSWLREQGVRPPA